MRVGCGSAAIGMFAPQWKDHVDEVIVVDDHITGVLSEHQGGRFLDMKPAGIRVRGRKSTPGRYFQVAEPGPGLGRHQRLRSAGDHREDRSQAGLARPEAADGLDHRRAFGLVRARPGPEAAAGRDAGAGAARRRAHRRELRAGALHRAVHGRRRRLAARRRHGKSRAADALGARCADQGHPGRRAGLRLAGRRHHPDGRCRAACRRSPSATCRRRRWWRRSSSPCAPPTMPRWAATPRAPSRSRTCCAPTRCGRRAQERADVSAVAARLADGRLHLQHGPIDLIIEAFGARDEVERAYGQAIERFGDILPTLVRELPTPAPARSATPIRCCRARSRGAWPRPCGRIAPSTSRRWPPSPAPSPTRCCRRCVRGRTLDKAYVNDGGDIAIHLAPGHELRAGIFAAGPRRRGAPDRTTGRCAASPPRAAAGARSRWASPTR